MKRAIILSIVVLLSVGVMLPFATNFSEASKKTQRKHKKVKKYSRAWWRMYRAKLRRQRALAARKRELAAQRENNRRNVPMAQVTQKPSATLNAPIAGWNGESVSSNGEASYRVSDASGKAIGSAQLAVVGVAVSQQESEVPVRMRDKLLAGVPVSSLRRAVIDKMIREQGWIVNDYQREVSGKKVFVVVAQTPNSGSVNSRHFYFTEVDGRIYSLSTTAPNDYSDKVAADSEQFLEKLQRGNDRSEEVTATTSLQ